MKKYLFGLLCLVLWCISAIGYAQSADSTQRAIGQHWFSIGSSPQYLAISGLRIDLEKCFGNKPYSVRISPYLYRGTTNQYEDLRNDVAGMNIDQDNYYQDEVSGWGLEAAWRFWLHSDWQNEVTFLSIGTGYHRVNLSYPDHGWVTYTHEDVVYYDLEERDFEDRIERVDFFLTIGLRTAFYQKFFLEVEAGPAVKLSDVNSTRNPERVYENTLMHYGFDGITLRAAFTIGAYLH